MRKVLAAWAVFKWLTGTVPQVQSVGLLLEQASRGEVELFMSWINGGEVFYSIAKRHGRAEADLFLNRVLPGMPVQLLVPDRDLIVEAARWKAGARIAYADAFALATAERLDAVLVTGDPELRAVPNAPIEWIG